MKLKTDVDHAREIVLKFRKHYSIETDNLSELAVIAADLDSEIVIRALEVLVHNSHQVDDCF